MCLYKPIICFLRKGDFLKIIIKNVLGSEKGYIFYKSKG